MSGPERTKTVYLIRHGESLGQIAQRRLRKIDPGLRDCGLTAKGRWQALNLPAATLGREAVDSIQLVISSPLTRAVHTALLAFPAKPILVHYDLSEVGRSIPENIPREMDDVINDIESLEHFDGLASLVDHETLCPDGWPITGFLEKDVIRRRIESAFQWLAETRPERVLAVVCHHNVIRHALSDNSDRGDQVTTCIHPQNAFPIACTLMEDGRLSLADHNSSRTTHQTHISEAKKKRIKGARIKH